VPIVVREVDDVEALELALIENLQRENLNPVEEARAFKRLGDEFNLSQEDIATRAGKTRSAVTNSIRLLQLPASVLAHSSRQLGRLLTQSAGLDSPRLTGIAKTRRLDGLGARHREAGSDVGRRRRATAPSAIWRARSARART
jgi:ParB-like chromosome segregation protein Spo0J